MRRILYLFVLLSGTVSSVLAAALTEEDHSPQALTRRYMSVLGAPAEDIAAVTTHKEGLAYIINAMKRLTGKQHTHVPSEMQYGFSFLHKNQAPIDFARDLMTGKKSWKKEGILSKPISIADIGCGLGFSAAYFISEVVSVYDAEGGWVLTSPIKLDLYDITPEHQISLRALAALANAAYPQYFHVETFVQDAGEPFPSKQQYNVAFALNILHYVPAPKWPSVIQNIEGILKDNGILFVTTDHYHIPTWRPAQCERLERAAKERTANPHLSPFVSVFLPLMNPLFGDAYLTRALNSSFDPFLKDPKGFVPGALKTIEELDMDAVRAILVRSAGEQLKGTASIGIYDGKGQPEVSVDEVIARLRDGRLVIKLGNYGFDEGLLEKAIHSSSKGTLVRLKTSWSKDLLKTKDGYPSSVGLTFYKKPAK